MAIAASLMFVLSFCAASATFHGVFLNRVRKFDSCRGHEPRSAAPDREGPLHKLPKEQGQEMLDRGKQVAQDTLESAKETAVESGSEHGKNVADELAATARGVAQVGEERELDRLAGAWGGPEVVGSSPVAPVSRSACKWPIYVVHRGALDRSVAQSRGPNGVDANAADWPCC